MARDLPEGRWVFIGVRVRESLAERIDAARGELNRSEWMRAAAERALEPGPVSERAPVDDLLGADPGWTGGESADEFVAAQRRRGDCKHPGVGRKQRCPKCGGFNV